MLEAEIIAHCAPTLAGIKTANMFTYTPGNRDDLQKEIEEALQEDTKAVILKRKMKN